MSLRAIHVLIFGSDAAALLQRQEAIDELGKEGFRAVTATTIGELRRLVGTKRPDVLLLDLDGEDPLPTLERVAGIAGEIPILGVATRGDTGVALEAIRRGARDCLLGNAAGGADLVRAIRVAVEKRQAHRASLERESLAVQGANDGIWDWDLERDELFLSSRWKAMLGYRQEEIGCEPREWLERVHADDLDGLRRELDLHLAGRSERFESEHRLRHRDGSHRWVLARGMAVGGPEGSPVRLVGSLTDIHARKSKEEQLLHDAMHDALTGLPNWVLFMDRLGVAIAQTRRYPDQRFAVLFLDLDEFKRVNDRVGHSLADRVLSAIGRRLQALVRPGDTVARLGGDEFGILASSIEDPSDATRIAERIHEELSRVFRIEGHEVLTSASIGIALSSEGYRRPEELVRDADTAMYRAKSMGSGRHAIFDEEMHRRALQLLRLETELREAVKDGQFLVHYQPIVSLTSGELEGLEALVRWRHPKRGLLFPREFMPVAEETGMIVPMGWWVMKQACRQMMRWERGMRAARGLWLGINLSGRQFLQGDLVDRLRSILEDTGLDPSRLRIEVTESMVVENAGQSMEKLARLDELGAQLVVEDFGAGLCSLRHLRLVPARTLKIDRSFVRHLDGDDGGEDLMRTIVNLAKDLGLRAGAEGLETAEQVARLRMLECSFGQGYFFSRPLDAKRAGELIASSPHW